MMIATVSTQRSGTKFLGSLFSTGNQVATFGEMFNPDDDGPLAFRGYLQARTISQICAAGSDGVVDHFLQCFGAIRGIFHFDLMFNQLEFCCTSWNGFHAPFMYGYLRSRSALVVLLKRDPTDTFVSMKKLEAFGQPHTLEAINAEMHLMSEDSESRELILKKADLELYSAWHAQQYAAAELAFEGYKYICRIDYLEIAENGTIPERLKDTIVELSACNNIRCEKDLIQAGCSVFKRVPSEPFMSITWI